MSNVKKFDDFINESMGKVYEPILTFNNVDEFKKWLFSDDNTIGAFKLVFGNNNSDHCIDQEVWNDMPLFYFGGDKLMMYSNWSKKTTDMSKNINRFLKGRNGIIIVYNAVDDYVNM